MNHCKTYSNTKNIVDNGSSFKTTPIFYSPINENNGNSILSADMQISAKGDASYWVSVSVQNINYKISKWGKNQTVKGFSLHAT